MTSVGSIIAKGFAKNCKYSFVAIGGGIILVILAILIISSHFRYSSHDF